MEPVGLHREELKISIAQIWTEQRYKPESGNIFTFVLHLQAS